MPTDHSHIVKSFDEELARLSDLISRMGGPPETTLAQSIEGPDQRLPALLFQEIAQEAEYWVAHVGPLPVHLEGADAEFDPAEVLIEDPLHPVAGFTIDLVGAAAPGLDER